MSHKCVATRSSSRLKAQEMGGESARDDRMSHNQVQGQGPIVAPAAPTTKDDFMATDDFMRLLRGYVDMTELFHTFRLVSKPWQRIAEEKIDEDFENGVLAFHDGSDKSAGADEDPDDFLELIMAKHEPVKRVVFFLNITKVGNLACFCAVNLVVVDIPEGVERIDHAAFCNCTSLTAVSFLTTLKSIGGYAFQHCSSLDNVDLLHTNLQELGSFVFGRYSELKSMTISDSLQRLGVGAFLGCRKLVPSNIDIRGYDSDGEEVPDATTEVIAYLRTQQRIAALEKLLAERDATIAERDAEVATLTIEVTVLTDKVATLTTEVAALKIMNNPPTHINDS